MAAMDYYKVLQLRADATDTDIQRGFREMALKYHPQKCKDPNAEEVFRNVCEAYDVLGSAKLRAIFDQFGSQGLRHGVVEEDGSFKEGYVFHGDVRKVFVNFFGCDNPFADYFTDQARPTNIFTKPLSKGETIMKDLELSLEELYLGTLKKMAYESKQLNADGHTCTVREGSVGIDVKSGWKDGTKVTFPNKGDEGPGIVPADVCYVVREIPHPSFKRKDNDLIYKVTLPLVEALTGCIVNIQTLDGRTLNVAISDVVHPSYTKTVKGEGMPISKQPGQKGDLILDFHINFPRVLTEQQKAQIKNAMC